MAIKKTKATKEKLSAVSVNATHEVNEFMAGLAHPRKAEIEAVRAIIVGADKRIAERVKWNAPNFYFKDDFATFKLRPMETIQVVFHTGAKVKDNPKAIKLDDPAGLMKWSTKDRGVVTFSDMQNIVSKKSDFVSIVKQWIEQM